MIQYYSYYKIYSVFNRDMPVLQRGKEIITTVPTTVRGRVADLISTIRTGRAPVYTDAETDLNKSAFDQMTQIIAFTVREPAKEALNTVRYPKGVRGVEARGIFAGFILGPETHRADPDTYGVIKDRWFSLPEQIRRGVARDIANGIVPHEIFKGDDPFNRTWYVSTGNSCFGVALNMLGGCDDYQPTDQWTNVVRGVLIQHGIIRPRPLLPDKILR